jgi:UDP-N-acetylglucosamine 1-carboxyvinyltransferase
MDRIRIRGGRPLQGEIEISGAKNASLPLMAAGLLTDERLVLTRVPVLADTQTMAALLAQHGIAVEKAGEDGRTLSLGGPIGNTEAPYDIVRKMRASILVLGPLLARCRAARVSLPGGCAIGTRPVDLHLKGLEQMGAVILLEGGYVNATAPNGLKGATIVFPMPSVGATENLLMAASLADGRTVLANAAREPEITDLCHCLVAMGAQISGIGTDRLTIDGVTALHGAHHEVIADRIETGTYACAAAITGGVLHLKGGRMEHLGAVMRTLGEAGVEITETATGLNVKRLNGLHGVDAMTEPYPGFPTDMQAQYMVLMSVAEGASMVTETIFENRFMHVPELNRMGARINVHGSSAIVRGVKRLSGAPVMATDLRARRGDHRQPRLSPGSRV